MSKYFSSNVQNVQKRDSLWCIHIMTLPLLSQGSHMGVTFAYRFGLTCIIIFLKCTSAWKKKIYRCHIKINLSSFFWNLLKRTNEALFLCFLETIMSCTIHHISLLYFNEYIHLPSLNLTTLLYSIFKNVILLCKHLSYSSM